jgi:hypothetical protein
MSSLVEFVRHLLGDGELTLEERPHASSKERAEAAAFLAEAFSNYRLEVAGPLIAFEAATALAAAEVVWQSCWFLVSRGEREKEMEKYLTMSGAPATAAQHLSADLTLRYLPQLQRRARRLAVDDRLTAILADLLRRWPLSGVLSQIEEGPLAPLDFGGHPGLMLLYAERLAENFKPAWVPSGQPFEPVELVFRELGKERLLPANASGSSAPAVEGESLDD